MSQKFTFNNDNFRFTKETESLLSLFLDTETTVRGKKFRQVFRRFVNESGPDRSSARNRIMAICEAGHLYYEGSKNPHHSSHEMYRTFYNNLELCSSSAYYLEKVPQDTEPVEVQEVRQALDSFVQHLMAQNLLKQPHSYIDRKLFIIDKVRVLIGTLGEDYEYRYVMDREGQVFKLNVFDPKTWQYINIVAGHQPVKLSSINIS